MKNETFVKVLVVAGGLTTGWVIWRQIKKRKDPEQAYISETLTDVVEKKMETKTEEKKTTIEQYDDLTKPYTGQMLKDISEQMEKDLAELNPGEHEPALPYQINADLYDSTCPEFRKESVVYYSLDDTFVIEETSKPIEDPNKMLGAGIRSLQVGETIYIRNEKEGADFVIGRVDAAWDEESLYNK